MPDGCLRRPQRVAYLRGKRDETARHDRARTVVFMSLRRANSAVNAIKARMGSYGKNQHDHTRGDECGTRITERASSRNPMANATSMQNTIHTAHTAESWPEPLRGERGLHNT